MPTPAYCSHCGNNSDKGLIEALLTFKAYIDNIYAKTGKTPDDFRKLAENRGLLNPGVKAMEVVNWLKKEHGLGHGHAMAIYATFKGRTE